MQTGLVTVVVPVYNTENYLERCLSSLVNQSYRQLEILIIDDGSPDRCPQICEEWAKRDGRIRVVHKENAGLGMARNTGMEEASGEYICFFDSDDYVDPDAIEKAYAAITKERADVVVFGFHNVNASGAVVSSFVPDGSKAPYRGLRVTEEFLPELVAPDPQGNGERLFYMSAWAMLYSMACIRSNHWRFVSEREIISEDVYSLLDLFHGVRSVAVLPEPLYFYCSNQVSLSRKYVPERYRRIRQFYLACLDLCDRHGYTEVVKRRVSDPYLAFTRAAIKQEVSSDRPYSLRYQAVKRILQDDVLRKVLRENGKDTGGTARRILFFAMKNRLYGLCFALTAAQNARQKRGREKQTCE